MSLVQAQDFLSAQDQADLGLAPDWQKIRQIEKTNILDQKYLEANTLSKKLILFLRRQFLSYHFLRPPLWKTVLRSRLTSERMIPDFALIGAVRSGTTVLSNYIMQHPCVALPLAKEIGLNIPTKKLILAQFPTQQAGKKSSSAMAKPLLDIALP